MRFLRRFAVPACVAACVAVTATACGGGGGSTQPGAHGLVTLRIAHNANAGVLPALFAQEQGIFAKHGINAKFTQVGNVANLPQALGNSFDIALAVPTSVISANVKGIKIRPVAGATLQTGDNPQSLVVASAASGVTKVSDLAGKRLGVPNTTGTLHLATLELLKHAGVDPASVKIVQVDPTAQADQLAQGRVDAVEAVAPFANSMLATKANVSLGDPYQALAPTIAAIGWVAQTQWADKHSDLVQNFQAALKEAIDAIPQHPDAARSSLQKITGVSDEVLAHMTFPTFTADVRRSDWQTWLDTMHDVGGFKSDFNVNTLFPGA